MTSERPKTRQDIILSSDTVDISLDDPPKKIVPKIIPKLIRQGIINIVNYREKND